jgi:methyl-accepting chemotaxis protein
MQGVVGSTNLISRSVSEVHGNVTTIAAVVEEQSVIIASINRTADELRNLNRVSH